MYNTIDYDISAGLVGSAAKTNRVAAFTAIVGSAY